MRFALSLSVLLLAGATSQVAAQVGHAAGAQPVNPLEPLQHRLAYAGATGMAVTWSTYSQLQQPVVYYGTNPSELTQQATGASKTYQSSNTWTNSVVIKGLKPGIQYYYQVANSNCYLCSELPTYSFRTAKAAGDATPHSTVLACDIGTQGIYGLSATVGKGGDPLTVLNGTNTLQSIYSQIDTFDEMIHCGDIAYADYWLREEFQGVIPTNGLNLSTEIQWYNYLNNQFMDQIQPISSVKPYMVAPGNHDSNCDDGSRKNPNDNTTYYATNIDVPSEAELGTKVKSGICVPGLQNFTGYQQRWRMPSETPNNVPGANPPFWYSYTNGLVHYIHIDTETDLGNGLVGPDEVGSTMEDEESGPFGAANQQINWLKADLAAVNRTLTPWVVVSGHRPYYGSNDDSDQCTVCQKAFEPLLVAGKVDLVTFGHVHLMERTAPMNNGTADMSSVDSNGNYHNPKFPIYLTNGAGGHYLGLDPLVYPLKNYSVKAIDYVYGWNKLTFLNATTMKGEFYASTNTSVLDIFYINKH